MQVCKPLSVASLLIPVLIALGGTGCSQNTGGGNAGSTTQPIASAGCVNKMCAPVNQDDPVNPKIEPIQYKGKTIGFCCYDCRAEFNKNPEKYMATLK